MFGGSFDINKLKSIAGHGKQFSAHCLKDSGTAVLQLVSACLLCNWSAIPVGPSQEDMEDKEIRSITNVQTQLLNIEVVPRSMFEGLLYINKLDSIAGHGEHFWRILNLQYYDLWMLASYLSEEQYLWPYYRPWREIYLGQWRCSDPSPEHLRNSQEYDRGFFDINKLKSIASHSKNLSLQYHESQSSFNPPSHAPCPILCSAGCRFGCTMHTDRTRLSNWQKVAMHVVSSDLGGNRCVWWGW